MAERIALLLAYAAASYAVRVAVLSTGEPRGRRRRYLVFAVVEAIAFLAVVRALWGRVPVWVAVLVVVSLAANVLSARFCGRCGRKPRAPRGATRCGECGGTLVTAWA